MTAIVNCSLAANDCENAWRAGHSLPGVDGRAYAVLEWDPDGAGPLAPRLVVGGSFIVAGEIIANNIAVWDYEIEEWSTLGSGFNGLVRDLVVFNGELYAAGGFTMADGQPANWIARWDAGTQSWKPLEGGLNFVVMALAVHENSLVVAGHFSTADGLAAQGVARWNGTTWQTMGSFGLLYAMCVHNGELYAGGANGIVRRWTGSTWQQVGTTLNSFVQSLHSHAGELYVGGSFSASGAQPLARIARLNSANNTWEPLGSGTSSSVLDLTSMVIDGQSELLVGGLFSTAGGMSSSGLARWNANSQTWTAVPTGQIFQCEDLLVVDQELIVAGRFAFGVQGMKPKGVARWAPADNQWFEFGTGTNERILGFAAFEGDVIAHGTFTTIDGVAANQIARFRHATQSWEPLGAGVGGNINALHVHDGELLVGGSLTLEGVGSATLARWNGKQWQSIPGLSPVFDLITHNGKLLACGGDVNPSSAYVAEWDKGTQSWNMLGTFDNTVYRMAMYNNDLIVSGRFLNVDSQPASMIARWNESTWSALGAGFTGDVFQIVQDLIVHNGQLLAVGEFLLTNGGSPVQVAEWSEVNQSWSQLGASFNLQVTSAVHYHGQLVVGGSFSSVGGVPALRVARWDGAAWTAFTGGVSGGQVDDMIVHRGQLVLGGVFAIAGGLPSPFFARWGRSGWNSPVDINCDGTVGVPDLLAVISQWGQCGNPPSCHADVAPAPGGDGVVGVPDLLAIIGSWGASD